MKDEESCLTVCIPCEHRPGDLTFIYKYTFNIFYLFYRKHVLRHMCRSEDNNRLSPSLFSRQLSLVPGVVRGVHQTHWSASFSCFFRPCLPSQHSRASPQMSLNTAFYLTSEDWTEDSRLVQEALLSTNLFLLPTKIYLIPDDDSIHPPVFFTPKSSI